MPGVSRGTRIIDCCRYFGDCGSLLPMKMNRRQRALPAPEVHHLRPLIRYASPSPTMELSILVASLEATRGSVMAKAERISPASSGSSHCFFCSGVP